MYVLKIWCNDFFFYVLGSCNSVDMKIIKIITTIFSIYSEYIAKYGGQDQLLIQTSR